jgi:hypothetical protein
MGKRILESIDRFPSASLPDAKWYRARPLRHGRDLAAEDFRAPDPAAIPIAEGRFNHYGQAVVYFADIRQAAAMEIVGEGERRAWVAEFNVSGISRLLNLAFDGSWVDDDLNLLAFGLAHSGHLTTPVDRSHHWKPEYFIPRLIADCAKLRGYEGLIVRSSKTWGRNLVLFQWDDQRISFCPPAQIVEIPTPASFPPAGLPTVADLSDLL